MFSFLFWEAWIEIFSQAIDKRFQFHTRCSTIANLSVESKDLKCASYPTGRILLRYSSTWFNTSTLLHHVQGSERRMYARMHSASLGRFAGGLDASSPWIYSHSRKRAENAENYIPCVRIFVAPHDKTGCFINNMRRHWNDTMTAVISSMLYSIFKRNHLKMNELIK